MADFNRHPEPSPHAKAVLDHVFQGQWMNIVDRAQSIDLLLDELEVSVAMRHEMLLNSRWGRCNENSLQSLKSLEADLWILHHRVHPLMIPEQLPHHRDRLAHLHQMLILDIREVQSTCHHIELQLRFIQDQINGCPMQ